MEILTYGEDGLTLWALKNRLGKILEELGDDYKATPEKCKVFYRPSFGRGRGCFGEFDFIIATDKQIYLGESKFYIDDTYHSSELTKEIIKLRTPQVDRADKFIRIISDKLEDKKGLLWKNIKSIKEILGVTVPQSKTFVHVIMVICADAYKNNWEKDSTQTGKTVKDIKFTHIYITADEFTNGTYYVPIKVMEKISDCDASQRK